MLGCCRQREARAVSADQGDPFAVESQGSQ